MQEIQGLRPGTVLHGTYRIERILGQGGFGITYLAFDITLERYVAVKEFFPKDFCDRDETTREVTLGTINTQELVKKLKNKFLKEARYIARLRHPGIIKIHGAFEENQTAYYVMDYIEGENLSEMVKRHGPLSAEQALRYIRMVGEALKYVHARLINHFDVKPANILIQESDDYPILIDFGLSREYDSAGECTTGLMGRSPGYSPMEQYKQGGIKSFSPQTDIYALGATLYYLLSGEPPTPAPELIEEDLEFPSRIPESLRFPISKAMSSRRADRQATVESFLEDLSLSERNLKGLGSIKDYTDNDQQNTIINPKTSTIYEGDTFIPINAENVTTSNKKVDTFMPTGGKKDIPTNNKVDTLITTGGKKDTPSNKKVDTFITTGGNTGDSGGNGIPQWVWMAVMGVTALIVTFFLISRCQHPSLYPPIDSLDSAVTDTTVNTSSGIRGFTETQGSEISDTDKDKKDSIKNATSENPELPEDHNETVWDLAWDSPLGRALYTGEVMIKGSAEEKIPDGKGIAKIIRGNLEGFVYDGEFVEGKMHGKAKYTYKNGDVFDGTFENNEFSQGKYTVKASGDYFIGTYKNGQPHKGKWYDKEGMVVSEL